MSRRKSDIDATLLPHNLDAERSVLGVLLLESTRIVEVSDLLSPADFYRSSHATIYAAIVRLAERNVRADFVTLKDALATSGELDDCGGPSYIASLADGFPRSTNLPYYAGIVRDRSLRRELILLARDAVAAAHDAETGADALEATMRAVSTVQVSRNEGEAVPMSVVMADTMRLVERLHHERRAVNGVATGLTDLDVYTRGMQNGQLVVVAARPGHGKTTFAINAARHVARDATALFFSLEMSRDEMGIRLLMCDSQQNGHRVQQGMIPDTAWASISNAFSHLSEARLLIDDTPHRTIQQIRMMCRRVAAQRGDLRLIVIDYLQLMSADRQTRAEKRNEELANITRGLKLLAKELRLPIMLVCQLNREVEHRKTKEPQLSDLADTGATEKDADQVWFPMPDDDDDTAQIMIAKNRGGPKGKVRVAYFESQYRFANLQGATV